MGDFRIGDKVEILEHEGKEYIGKKGTLIKADKGRPAIEGLKLTQITCKVRLDKNGEIVTCFLSQLKKL
jgi:hypothetical protein